MKQIESIPKRFTKGQIFLERILNKLGFQTVLEYSVGLYYIDIFVPELNLGIEFEGMGHFKRRDAKRDKEIFNNSGIRIARIKQKQLNERDIQKIIGGLENENFDR